MNRTESEAENEGGLNETVEDDAKDESEDAVAGADEAPDDVWDASLLHIITNVVVLQEFVLELVSLMQVRASLFDEVKHV